MQAWAEGLGTRQLSKNDPSVTCGGQGGPLQVTQWAPSLAQREAALAWARPPTGQEGKGPATPGSLLTT